MSRVAKCPIVVPSGINIQLDLQDISIKGKYGYLSRTIHQSVKIEYLNARYKAVLRGFTFL